LNKTAARPIAFDLTQAGDYQIRLTVSDETNQSDTDVVNIRVEGQRRNDSCLEMKSIEGLFERFAEDNSSTANDFGEAFPAFKEVEAYFRSVLQVNLSGTPVPEQLVFFLTFEFPIIRDGTEVTVAIVEALIVWLESLFLIIQEPDDRKIRNHAMRLYNILLFLGMYITCIQRGGEQDRRVDTLELFQLVEQQMTSLNQDFVRNLDEEHVMQLMRLRAMVDDEIFLIESTGQGGQKKDYLEVLQSIRSIIDQLSDL
jgi:hypothetical protein